MPPWSVGLLGQVAAVKALEDPDHYRARYDETHRARETPGKGLAELGLEVIPGRANFLLVFVPTEGPDAAAVVERCQRRGVHLRDASTMGTALGENALRVAVKSPEQNERILAVLREALREDQT